MRRARKVMLEINRLLGGLSEKEYFVVRYCIWSTHLRAERNRLIVELTKPRSGVQKDKALEGAMLAAYERAPKGEKQAAALAILNKNCKGEPLKWSESLGRQIRRLQAERRARHVKQSASAR
jgi:hypothetical protein